MKKYLYHMKIETGRLCRYEILEEDIEDSLYWIRSSATSAIWILKSDSRYMEETAELKKRYEQENPEMIYFEALETLESVEDPDIMSAVIELASPESKLSEAEIAWAKKMVPGLIVYPQKLCISQLCDFLKISIYLTSYGWNGIFTISEGTFTTVNHNIPDDARLASIRLFKSLGG